ncbi:MAG TPA: PilZ domain-containing protein [Pirellulales bacterium]|nr:PilZ domain-containing protein [Pirellulales bacterium]
MRWFQHRDKHFDLNRIIRRLINASTPNRIPLQGESRWELRANRTMPVLLVPYDANELSIGEQAYALTKNLSGQGLALVLHQPLRAEQLVVAFWSNDEPHFFAGTVRQSVPLGGGFWQIGVETSKLLSMSDCPDLQRLVPWAARLDPSVHWDAPVCAGGAPQ